MTNSMLELRESDYPGTTHVKGREGRKYAGARDRLLRKRSE